MVVDLKLFQPGSPLQADTLWVVEQVPGLTVAEDQTQVCRLGHGQLWPALLRMPNHPVNDLQILQRTQGLGGIIELPASSVVRPSYVATPSGKSSHGSAALASPWLPCPAVVILRSWHCTVRSQRPAFLVAGPGHGLLAVLQRTLLPGDCQRLRLHKPGRRAAVQGSRVG